MKKVKVEDAVGLHSGEEFSLKGLDRAGMREKFLKAARAKPDDHGPLAYGSPSGAGRDMNQIGG